MKKKLNLIILLSIALLCFDNISQASNRIDSVTIVEHLDKCAIPISLASSIGFQQFHFLDESIKDSRVVGLGEAAHGNHEFLKGQTEIMKYLITNLNFKLIGFECNYGSFRLLNKYINGEYEDIDKAMRQLILNSITKDMLEFVKWLKSYNGDKEANEQVSLFGYDNKSGYFAIEDLKRFLEDNNSLNPELKDALNTLKEPLYKVPKGKMHAAAKLLSSTMSCLKMPEDISYKQQVVLRSVEFASASGNRKTSKRDQYMAENCKWIFDHHQNKKMIIYAHNMHVTKHSGSSNVKRMGVHLSQMFPDYFVIGTGFNRGKTGIIGSRVKEIAYHDAVENSYDYLFKRSEYTSFYLDINQVKTKELNSYLSQKNNSRNTGGVASDTPQHHRNNYRYHTLSKSYDALLFFDKVSPAVHFCYPKKNNR